MIVSFLYSKYPTRGVFSSAMQSTRPSVHVPDIHSDSDTEVGSRDVISFWKTWTCNRQCRDSKTRILVASCDCVRTSFMLCTGRGTGIRGKIVADMDRTTLVFGMYVTVYVILQVYQFTFLFSRAGITRAQAAKLYYLIARDKIVMQASTHALTLSLNIKKAHKQTLVGKK